MEDDLKKMKNGRQPKIKKKEDYLKKNEKNGRRTNQLKST